MGRIRSIKPAFFLDDDLAKLPFEARLAFIGLWTLADRDGILEYRPPKIKVQVFPYEIVDMDVILNDLATTGHIVRYCQNGQPYIKVLKFTKHQRVHHTECKSSYPQPTEEDGKAPAVARVRIEDEMPFEPSPEKPKPKPNPWKLAFEQFWTAYPRRTGKGKAIEMWLRIKPQTEEMLKHIIESVERHKACDQWQKDGGQFIPHPSTWLHQTRYEDEPEAGQVIKPQRKTKKCAACDNRAPVHGLLFCQECSWCVQCDRKGLESRKDPKDLVLGPDGLAWCKKCSAEADDECHPKE